MRSLRTRRRSCSAELGALVVAAALAVAPGCGGDDAPGYCSELTELEQSVRDLGDVDVVNGGLDAVREALDRVDENARSVVDSAKDDFPEETDAISQATADLETTAGELTESPTAQEGARLVGDVEEVVSSVDAFVDAAGSECD
jgi:hypothetical protein